MILFIKYLYILTFQSCKFVIKTNKIKLALLFMQHQDRHLKLSNSSNIFTSYYKKMGDNLTSYRFQYCVFYVMFNDKYLVFGNLNKLTKKKKNWLKKNKKLFGEKEN